MTKVFIFWVAIIPLVVWNSRYEVPKVFIFLLGSVFTTFYLFLGAKSLELKKRDYWFLLWLLSLFLGGLFSEDFKQSLLGGSYRHQGFIFFFGLWVLIKVVERFNSKNIKLLYKAVAVTVILEAIIVMLGRRIGTIGEINAVSGFLAIGTYFVFVSFKKVFTLFPILGVFLNFSKSAILSFIPYLLSKSKLGMVIILLGTILVFIIKPIDKNSIFENRQIIWGHTGSLILEKPIFGFGAESNEVLFDRKFYESGFPLSNLIIDRSHNLFLDITLWSGIVGLTFFILFLKETFLKLDNFRRKALISFLIFSMFQPLSVVHWILFALIL